MSGADWARSFIRNSDSLYESIRERREDFRRRHSAELADEISNPFDEIYEELAGLKLIVGTMLQVLMANGLISEEDFAAQAARLDAADGNADGRLNGSIGPDGTVTIDAPPPPGPLDELNDALDEER
jgi:hypothetical protein